MLRALNKLTVSGLMIVFFATSFLATQLPGQDQEKIASKRVGGKSLSKGDDVEFGLKVGESAPDFTLKDQNGNDVKLSDLTAKGLVAVVFHRSASW